jgi:hypothetical protein
MPPDVIVRQLLHVEQNKIHAGYDVTERLTDGGNMMRAWVEYLRLQRPSQGLSS